MNHWHNSGFILGDLPTGVVPPALHSLFLERDEKTTYTLTKDPKQFLFWERFGGLQVRGTTRFEGLQVRGATRLHTTDFGYLQTITDKFPTTGE